MAPAPNGPVPVWQPVAITTLQQKTPINSRLNTPISFAIYVDANGTRFALAIKDQREATIRQLAGDSCRQGGLAESRGVPIFTPRIKKGRRSGRDRSGTPKFLPCRNLNFACANYGDGSIVYLSASSEVFSSPSKLGLFQYHSLKRTD